VFDVWPGWSNEPNRTGDVTGFFDEFLRKDAVRAGETIGVEHAEEFRVLDPS
jgi:hypothetical protein